MTACRSLQLYCHNFDRPSGKNPDEGCSGPWGDRIHCAPEILVPGLRVGVCAWNLSALSKSAKCQLVRFMIYAS